MRHEATSWSSVVVLIGEPMVGMPTSSAPAASPGRRDGSADAGQDHNPSAATSWALEDTPSLR